MNGFKRQKKPDRALSDQSLIELMIRLPCCPFVEQAQDAPLRTPSFRLCNEDLFAFISDFYV